MTRPALLLLLVAAWYYAPDFALMLDGSTRIATYRANGIFGAVLCILARETRPAVAWRAVCDMAAFFWVMQPVCDAFWVTEGVHTASVCDSVFSLPLSDMAGAGMAVLAGWIYDKGGRDA